MFRAAIINTFMDADVFWRDIKQMQKRLQHSENANKHKLQ